MSATVTETKGVEFKGLNGSATTLAPETVAAFRAAFRGPLLFPADPGYDETRQIWNAMIDRRPALIARCTGTADVVAAVRFAREHGLLSSVRGGGHNIAGLAVVEGGLMIDLSLMKGVWVDPEARIAHAQAGCTLGDLDRETQLHGLAAPLGFVSETGIAGLTVGGGFGYLSRSLGWTCDNLVSVEVVTAEGKVVRAADEENDELFWCLRGGSGNFGIVTSFAYRLFPVGPEIVGGAVVWKAADAADVLDFYRDFTATAPREVTAVAVLRFAPPAPWLPADIHGKPIIAIFACHSGGDLAAGEELVRPIKTFGKPVADILGRRPFVQMQSLLDATQPKGRRYYWKSEYLSGLEPGLLHGVVD
ncbi:MAG: FAD-binding oxidoreductase, partial [Gemmatimonadota bacterium]